MSTATEFRPFMLGRVLATPGALELLSEHDSHPHQFLRRHLAGDWGDVCSEDASLNNSATVDGSRIMSAYPIGPNGDDRIWIITEAEDDDGKRAATTLLLPDEY